MVRDFLKMYNILKVFLWKDNIRMDLMGIGWEDVG
jgi:hypothetical protein